MAIPNNQPYTQKESLLRYIILFNKKKGLFQLFFSCHADKLFRWLCAMLSLEGSTFCPFGAVAL
jgi:hypothetical protein